MIYFDSLSIFLRKLEQNKIFRALKISNKLVVSRRQKAEGRRQKVKDTSCLVSGGRHFTFNYVHLLITAYRKYAKISLLYGYITIER